MIKKIIAFMLLLFIFLTSCNEVVEDEYGNKKENISALLITKPMPGRGNVEEKEKFRYIIYNDEVYVQIEQLMEMRTNIIQ